MALLDKLKKKTGEASVGTEVYDLYKEIASLEKKIINKYPHETYFSNYCKELQSIKFGKKLSESYGSSFNKEDGFDIPKKYSSIVTSFDMENVILKKFEDKLNAFNIEEDPSTHWWCPAVSWYGDSSDSKKAVGGKYISPDFGLIESSNKKDAIKEIKKLCASSKKILLENNYKLKLKITGQWQTWTGDFKTETLYEKKKTDMKNYRKEIDNFFELCTKEYLNMEI